LKGHALGELRAAREFRLHRNTLSSRHLSWRCR